MEAEWVCSPLKFQWVGVLLCCGDPCRSQPKGCLRVLALLCAGGQWVCVGCDLMMPAGQVLISKEGIVTYGCIAEPYGLHCNYLGSELGTGQQLHVCDFLGSDFHQAKKWQDFTEEKQVTMVAVFLMVSRKYKRPTTRRRIRQPEDERMLWYTSQICCHHWDSSKHLAEPAQLYHPEPWLCLPNPKHAGFQVILRPTNTIDILGMHQQIPQSCKPRKITHFELPTTPPTFRLLLVDPFASFACWPS